MNRRPTQGQPDPLRAETDAAAIKATIGRLLGLLSRKPTMVEHPIVAPEIYRLAEWLVITSEQAGHNPGRHRAETSQPSLGVRQAEAELELELAAVQTPAEFVAQLRQQIAQSGLTLREIAAVAKQQRVYSTISGALNRNKLPTIGVVEAIIIGCARDEYVLSLFMATWQRLKTGHGSGRNNSPDLLSAPVPPPRLLQGV
jgi:hypothetical protein